MKTRIVYYSRTNTTKTVAEMLAKKMGADFEEIIPKDNFDGAIGWMRAGKQGAAKQSANIKTIKKNPDDYDLVILGTPIWGNNISSPLRAYLDTCNKSIKKAAFFCTMSSSGDDKAFTGMKGLLEQEPVATVSFRTKEVKKEDISSKIEAFTSRLT